MKKSVDWLILLLYAFVLYQVYQICFKGGLRSRLPLLLICLGILIVFLLVKLILRGLGNWPSFSRIRLITFLAITLLFGGLITYTGIPYHGQLSWKIMQLLNEKQVEFVHRNLYQDGVYGLLKDIRKKMNVPDTLYVLDEFSVQFKKNGTITKVDVFLYGRDTSGKVQTFLLSYDEAQSKKLIVQMNGKANATFDEAASFTPLLQMFNQVVIRTKISPLTVTNDADVCGLLYIGKRQFTTAEGLESLDEKGREELAKLNGGGAVEGFAVSLFIPQREDILPLRLIMNPKYITPDTIEQSQEKQIINQSQQSKTWTTDSQDGSVYYFVPEQKSIGYRLKVADAAAGSRYYVLEKTEDGGTHWQTIHENPFAGVAGVAEGIEFFTSDFGFIGVTGASQTHSQIFMTKDGGKTFTEVLLPFNQVKEMPEKVKTYGLKLEDFQYLSMPFYQEGKLVIHVSTSAGETEHLSFYSQDEGVTWTFENK